MKRYLLLGLALLIIVGVTVGAVTLLKFVGGIAPIVRQQPVEFLDEENLGLMLPDGFSAHVFAGGLQGPRVMAYDPDGMLVVSQPNAGSVVGLQNADTDDEADEIVTILDGLDRPHGITFRCAESREITGECLRYDLYVAETRRVGEYDYNARTRTATFRRVVAELPGGENHYTRTIAFRPYPNENELMISVGSSCNVCIETDERRAATLVVDVTKNEPAQVFSRGLRNAVFMRAHPVTGDMWATEMGRDLLGDDLPPDELNVLIEGGNYGWPICYGANVHDTNFDKNTYIRNPCMEPFEIPSRVNLPAHSAPLGIAFVPEEGWPEAWWHDAIVAYHGSWNRSVPTGYKLVRIDLDAAGNFLGTIEDFITGFMDSNGDVLGRPVDVLIQPGGTMFISDDRAGVIYRVSRSASE